MTIDNDLLNRTLSFNFDDDYDDFDDEENDENADKE